MGYGVVVSYLCYENFRRQVLRIPNRTVILSHLILLYDNDISMYKLFRWYSSITTSDSQHYIFLNDLVELLGPDGIMGI